MYKKLAIATLILTSPLILYVSALTAAEKASQVQESLYEQLVKAYESESTFNGIVHNPACKARVNHVDKDGNTSLHLAAMSKFFDCNKIVSALLAMRANPNVINKEGYTPLSLTLKHQNPRRASDIISSLFFVRRCNPAVTLTIDGKTYYGILDFVSGLPARSEKEKSDLVKMLYHQNSVFPDSFAYFAHREDSYKIAEQLADSLPMLPIALTELIALYADRFDSEKDNALISAEKSAHRDIVTLARVSKTKERKG